MKSLRRAFLGLLMLGGAAAPAVAGWSEARTKHFIIYSEQRPDDLKAYAERLERFDAIVRFMRKMDDPALTDGGKVTIYVLPNVAAVQRLYGQVGSGVLGFYIPRASGSVAFFASKGTDSERDPTRITPEHVFQHEYMHHLMLSDWKSGISPWLVEGMAEFFGTTEIDRTGAAKIGAPPQTRAYGVRQDIGFNVEQLLSSKPASNAEERESVYGKGWVLTHMMAFDKSRTGQLDKYLRGLERGEKPVEAAKAAFGDLKVLDKDLDKYAVGKFRGMTVSPGPQPAVTIRPLSPGDSAVMNLRIRSERGVDEKGALDIANDARRAAASVAPSPFVYGVLAESEYDAKNYAAAIAATDKALAIDPANVQAMTYKARAMMAQAKADKSKADWAEIRRLLIRANRADTENAEPLWLYYQTFGKAGETPPKSAVDGLIYALALAPQDRALRLDTVRQLLVSDRPEEAGALFGVMVNDPHLPIAQQTVLTSVLAKIKSGDSKGALAMMDEERAKAEKKAAAKG
ncbi:DUF1570 domain-containing protein [Sphingomonas rosea]|uniref:DUF1570 domain-containing protein n=1 Tax=Sphingomonas rosea TaxID=335605 RepID=A0ABP7U9H0_9SPHN